jgi:biopolymer transport protein ExbB
MSRAGRSIKPREYNGMCARAIHTGEGRWYGAAWSALVALAAGLAAAGVAQSQEERNPAPEAADVLAPPSPEGAAMPGSRTSPVVKPRTLMDNLRAGGYIGGTILLLSVAALGFAIEHAITIRKERLMPSAVLDELEDLIARGDLQAAVDLCSDPRNESLATEVVLAGLTRYQSSELGFADYQSAVEEAGEDYTARLYRKTDALNVISVVAPMLGLFGTVAGMMESFNILASTQGAAKPYELADSISKALVTTWLGLIVAIPSTVAYSYFRNKIDSLVSECGNRVERVLTPLGRRRLVSG